MINSVIIDALLRIQVLPTEGFQTDGLSVFPNMLALPAFVDVAFI